MIVIAIVGLFATVAITETGTNITRQLDVAAQVVASDLNYARGLAVMNNTQYRLTFDLNANSYVLRHSGTNSAFNNLPDNPFRPANDKATESTMKLDSVPDLADAGIRLYRIQTGTQQTALTTLEFLPLGNTTVTTPTEVWLAAGTGTSARYVLVRVDPVSGLVTIGDQQTSPPGNVVMFSGPSY